jgi:ankyrin repeat protein
VPQSIISENDALGQFDMLLINNPDPVAALAAAVRSDDAGCVEAILTAHPSLVAQLDDPMPGEAFGSTPLLGAVQRRNREMIEVLLRAGADINARSHWWAGSFGVLDAEHGLSEFLIERGAIVDAHAAARLGMLERLKELVAADPSVVHARGGDGQTPLHFAANIEIAGFLLDHGADIDARDIDHESTAAQYMVRSRQDVARYLVERGCESDLLMAAALGDLQRVIQILDGDPALIRMRASEHYFPKKDPRAGGSIYIWTLGNHKSVHEIAREYGHEEIFRQLMDRTSDDLKLLLVCELGDEETFNALFATTADLVERLSEDDCRKVAYAAQANNTRAVGLMLKAGWPVDARGQHGGTALHWAAWHGNAEMVREILRYNPPIEDSENQFHATPLGWATHGSENSWHRKGGDYISTVRLLCAAGARIPASISGTPAVQATLMQLSAPA